MASFDEVLRSPDKKWKRKSWQAGQFSKDAATSTLLYHRDITATDWEVVEEPKKKVTMYMALVKFSTGGYFASQSIYETETKAIIDYPDFVRLLTEYPIEVGV
jgi:hypothetical protein